MSATLIIIFQLLLSLSILVVLHEAGHFFAAKFFGTKVDKFYLFFNPWFSLYKKKIGKRVLSQISAEAAAGFDLSYPCGVASAFKLRGRESLYHRLYDAGTGNSFTETQNIGIIVGSCHFSCICIMTKCCPYACHFVRCD